jgi:hypothetical protein
VAAAAVEVVEVELELLVVAAVELVQQVVVGQRELLIQVVVLVAEIQLIVPVQREVQA